MDIHAIAIGLIIFPVSLVHITVSVPEFALPIGLVVLPLAFIFGAVGPYLGARSMAHAVAEIALIDGAIFKHKFFNELETLCYGLTLELGDEVIGATL
jgi:hypothetical protein